MKRNLIKKKKKILYISSIDVETFILHLLYTEFKIFVQLHCDLDGSEKVNLDITTVEKKQLFVKKPEFQIHSELHTTTRASHRHFYAASTSEEYVHKNTLWQSLDQITSQEGKG